MKVRDGYLQKQIADQTYLLPYGQNIADHKHGMKLNESGILLWEALQKHTCEEELLTQLMEHYHADTSDIPMLRQDIRLFTQQLLALGILYEDAPTKPPATLFFQIGTLILAYDGPKQLLPPSFFDFTCEMQPADQMIHLIPGPPSTKESGRILICTNEITICENDHYYLFFYPDSFGLLECHLTKDGSQADFYYNTPFSESLTERLFHAIRFTFLVKAQMKGLFAIHSASVLYQGRAWLFSGSSGTGKSTHTALWQKLFQTPLLNGDLNLIGIEHNQPVVFGIPWCGTSGIYTSADHPLGGIVFLRQHPTDAVISLTDDEKQLFVAHRLISPAWTCDMLHENLSFASRLSAELDIFCLYCTKEDSAAVIIKQEIDRYINLSE